MEYYIAMRTTELLLLATTWSILQFYNVEYKKPEKNNSTSMIPFICLSKTDTINIWFRNQEDGWIVIGHWTGNRNEEVF